MSGFSAFNFIDHNGVAGQKAIAHSQIREVTLLESGNTILLKGKKKPLPISDSARDIAQALGIWRPRGKIKLTPAKQSNSEAVYVPTELIANSSEYVLESDHTRILTPDGQHLEVKETPADIATKLRNINVFYEDIDYGSKSDILIF